MHAISTSQKQSAAGQLTQAYFESKHKLESSFDLPNSKFEPTVPSSKPHSSIGESTSHNMLRAPASKMHPGITHHSDPTRQTTPVWFNQPHVEFKRLGDAMSALGPTILHVNKFTNKGKCITEYKCRFPNCKRRMREVSPGDGPFSGPFFTGSCFHFYNHLTCNHAAVFPVCWWATYPCEKDITGKQGRKKRRKTGLERPNKYQLRKMAQEQARLTSIGTFDNPSPKHEMCHPITQTQDEAYLV
jgi:hypothetical protein